jgi:dolichol-phosphate mannosyltransferase
VSVVIPAYNEVENLPTLYARLAAVLDSLACPWEIIIVDDGSMDETQNVVRDLQKADSRVRGIILSRNFGHEPACTAGLDVAEGDAVVLMDADLQDPPELIPELVDQWREGFDIVSGQRTSRQGEGLLKRWSAYCFYRVMNGIVRWDFPKDIGNFRLMDRKVVEAVRQCPERNRFVRALTAWSGFRQTTVPFDRAARHKGVTKYTFVKVIGLGLTSLTGYSNDPLRLATILGVLLSSGAIILLAILACMHLVTQATPAMGYIFASVWLLGGVQCVLIGLVGEYIGRIYTECRQRPVYFVQETIGTHDDTA